VVIEKEQRRDFLNAGVENQPCGFVKRRGGSLLAPEALFEKHVDDAAYRTRALEPHQAA
jgi:hypothetical protein